MGRKIMAEQVRDILDRWLLAETQHRLADAGLEDNPPNHLCISVIPIVHTYTMAVLDLIPGYKLPPMGLLRVLAEIVLTTCWCLIEPDPEVKIRRWLKESYIQRKKLLERTIHAQAIPNDDKAAFGEGVEEFL